MLCHGVSVRDPVALAREITEKLINCLLQVVVEGEDDGHSRITQLLQKKAGRREKICKLVEELLDLTFKVFGV